MLMTLLKIWCMVLGNGLMAHDERRDVIIIIIIICVVHLQSSWFANCHLDWCLIGIDMMVGRFEFNIELQPIPIYRPRNNLFPRLFQRSLSMLQYVAYGTANKSQDNSHFFCCISGCVIAIHESISNQGRHGYSRRPNCTEETQLPAFVHGGWRNYPLLPPTGP
jgi:hypothetical protein